MKIVLEKNKTINILGIINFRLNKVYNVKKYTLRASLLIEEQNSNRTHKMSLSAKKQSVISAVGYSVTVTGLDIESQTMIIEVKFK